MHHIRYVCSTVHTYIHRNIHVCIRFGSVSIRYVLFLCVPTLSLAHALSVCVKMLICCRFICRRSCRCSCTHMSTLGTHTNAYAHAHSYSHEVDRERWRQDIDISIRNCRSVNSVCLHRFCRYCCWCAYVCEWVSANKKKMRALSRLQTHTHRERKGQAYVHLHSYSDELSAFS